MSVGQINKILTEDLCVPEVSWIAQVQVVDDPKQ